MFADPGFQVRGASTRDQIWIDETVESGIAACGWRRPRPR